MTEGLPFLFADRDAAWKYHTGVNPGSHERHEGFNAGFDLARWQRGGGAATEQMTEPQRAALLWAVGVAEVRASEARRARMNTGDDRLRKHHKERALVAEGMAAALRELLT